MMNLASFRKIAFVAGVLSGALYAQQALADEAFLYCTNQNAGRWDWAKTNGTQLNNGLNIGTNEGDYLKLQGFYPGSYEVHPVPHEFTKNIVGGNGMFFISTLLKNNTMRNEQQAKAACEELQRFCPGSSKENDQIYLGAAWNSASSSHQVGMYFKNDPSNPEEKNSILVCPSWEYEKGITDNSCGTLMSPAYTDPVTKLPKRDVRSAGIGPACR